MNASTSSAIHAALPVAERPSARGHRLPLIYLLLMIAAAVELVAVFSTSIAFRLENPGWKTISHDDIYGDWQLDLHAATASLWMVLFFTQTGLGMAALRCVPWSERAHRVLGWALCTVLAFAFAAFALRMSFLNPVGLGLFASANIVYILFCAIAVLGVGVAAAIRGDIEQHIDSQFMVCMILTGPSTVRLLKLFAILFLGGDVVSEVTNSFAVWAVILIKTVGVLALRGRLRSNRVSVSVLFAGVGGAAIWALLASPAG